MFGVLLSLAGSILFLTALAMTLRANATSTVPFWRNPAETPVGSVAMRSIGAGLLVFGAVMLTAEGWRWPGADRARRSGDRLRGARPAQPAHRGHHGRRLSALRTA